MENNNLREVIISSRAYNAIINETFDFEPIETGGILLGHEADGIWIVLEVISPGYKSLHQHALFEYDEKFVNYCVDRISSQYAMSLKVLGLWHRHPGGMDVFSTVDDETNKKFASLNEFGAISGLVNVDPNFRMTMYYIANSEKNCSGRPKYERLPITVNDECIPPELFQLRYYNGTADNLHPGYDKKGIVAQQFQNDSKPVRDIPSDNKYYKDSDRNKSISAFSTIFNVRSLLGVIILLQLFTMLLIHTCNSDKDNKEKTEIVSHPTRHKATKIKVNPVADTLKQDFNPFKL